MFLGPFAYFRHAHTGRMKKRAKLPEVSDLVRSWMPDASHEELVEATNNLHEYLAVIYRITLRREAEEKYSMQRDNSGRNDTVDD